VSYDPNWVGQNVDEDKLFVPSRLFDQNAQITHTESTSGGQKTQSWSVKKGTRLLREPAHDDLEDAFRELQDDVSDFIRELRDDESELREWLSDITTQWWRWW
jgi:hypothetical protein